MTKDTDAHRGALRSRGLTLHPGARRLRVMNVLRVRTAGLESVLDEGFIHIKQKNIELWKALFFPFFSLFVE